MRATSAGDLCQAMSGCRRIVPVAEHGASRSTRLTGRGGRQASASATSIRASSWRRSRLLRRRPARLSDSSTAVTAAPAAASCAVLPPGAAHRSIALRPRTSPSSRAGSAAAASWTHQAPSAYPGRSSIAPPAGRRTVLPYSRSPPRRAAQTSGSAFTVRSSGGSARWASATACAAASPYADLQLSHSQSGVFSRAASWCARSLRAFARDPPQHGVDQALGVAMRAAGQRHGLGHGGVGRGVQEQELRGAEPEQVVHADRLGARTHEPVEQQRRSGRAGATRWSPAGGRTPGPAGRAGRAPGARRTSPPAGAPRPAPGRAHPARSGARSPGGPWSRAQAADWSGRSPRSTRRISAVVSAGP